MRKRKVLFSSRINGINLPDVLTRKVSDKVRNQIILSLTDFLGHPAYGHGENVFILTAYMHLLEEYGVSILQFNGFKFQSKDLLLWMTKVSDIEFIDALDMLIGSYNDIMEAKRNYGVKGLNDFVYSHNKSFGANLRDLNVFISKVNVRFREGGCAYELNKDGDILLIDNIFVHDQIVKQAISLIGNNSVFKLVEDEFYDAFDDYRNGNFDASMVNSNKAFETTMKIICHQRNYKLQKGDKSTCAQLVDCLDINGYLDDGMAHPLKNGLPVVRNNHSHGQGNTPKQATEHEAMFCLHIMASHINYLIKKF